jgi:subtilisin family serine protease
MKKIWIGFTLSIMILMTIVIVSNSTLEEGANSYVPLSSLRTNYDLDKKYKTDSDGNLNVPYDIAYPEAFKSGAVAYDSQTIHIKVLTKDLGVISLNMRNAGIESLTKLFGDQSVTWYEAKISSRLPVEDVMKHVRALDEVLLADYNYTYQKESFSAVNPIYLNGEMEGIFDDLNVSDNPLSAQQWYLDRFGIPEAWAWLVDNGYQAGGSEDVVVAVIDTGVDYNHPDLKANMWVNPKEVKNGSDTDGNGFIDDIHGASVISDGRFWSGDPMDDHGHGTHVAGIIAASNNKEGIIGIAHNVKIMAVKSGMSSGFFTSSAIAKGIEYAYSNGADVINMSFGGSLPAIAVQDALMLAYTTSVLVASAGNNGLPNEYCPPYPVYGPNYPAALSYVIGVMSVGPSLVESSFSNWDCKAYNKFEYEINAPGESMMSTLPNGQYVSWNGTSMAAPVVSAVAALVRSVYNDRDVYPNKFVMGQVNAATTTTATSALGRPIHNIPFVIDAYKALTSLPKPEISLFDYYIYDPVSLSERNNGMVLLIAVKRFKLVLFFVTDGVKVKIQLSPLIQSRQQVKILIKLN